MIMMTKRKH